MIRQQARRIAFKAKKRAAKMATQAANKLRQTRVSCRVIARANSSRRDRLRMPEWVYNV